MAKEALLIYRWLNKTHLNWHYTLQGSSIAFKEVNIFQEGRAILEIHPKHLN